MKTFKKALACFLVVAMFLTAAPLSGFVGFDCNGIDLLDIFNTQAEAAEIITAGTLDTDMQWKLDSEGTLTISGEGAMNDHFYREEIPWYSMYASVKKIIIEDGITSIGSYVFRSHTNLTTVVLADSVTDIGIAAFDFCDNLENVIIPESVKSIGSGAFSGCPKLKEIIIPAGVISIGVGVFSSCSSLSSITVDAGNTSYSSDEYGVLFNYDKTTLLQYPAGNTRTHYEIPDSVKSIETGAFSNCDNLVTVSIPNGVTNIPDNMFSNCDNLTSIDIPASVSSIDSSAFFNCSNLANISISDKTAHIGREAFSGTAYYSNTDNWQEGVLYIGNYLIAMSPDFSGGYIIANDTRTIAEYAFFDCTQLTSVAVPASVTSINEYAFSNCDSLTSIMVDSANAYYSNDSYGVLFNKEKTELIKYPSGNKRKSYIVPDSVVCIEENAFEDSINLSELTLSESGNLTHIKHYAFYNCDNITNIIIPQGVKNIDQGIFYHCDKLTNISIPDSVESIGSGILDVTAYYKDESNWENDVLYIGNHLIAAKTNISGEYLIRETTKTIAGSAFEWSGISAVTIPDSVVSIGDYAFARSSLSSVTIPVSVKKIGYCAFFDIYHFAEITILNPDCEIYDSAVTIDSGATIYGYTNSTAQTYAEKYGRTFVALDMPTSELIVSDTSTAKLLHGFVINSIATMVADILAASNGTAVLDKDGNTATPDSVLATGMVLAIMDGETVVDSMKIVVLGDTDGDGAITAGDARNALRHSVGLDLLEGAYLQAAGVGNDGTVSAGDAREILRASVGLDDPAAWFDKF